jgi:hypothetical protein
MEVKVTTNNVQEFKPIRLLFELTIEDVSELASLSVDADIFAGDGLKVTDSSGRPYSDELNEVITVLFSNLIKSKPEEGEKKQS